MATGLTERSIRLYLSKDLISPIQINGILDFSAKDIQQLKDISVLRQMDFSIEQISAMIHDTSAISGILSQRLADAQAELDHKSGIQSALSELEGYAFDSIHAVAAQIRTIRTMPPMPDFAKFDTMSDEQRQTASKLALQTLSKIQKRSGAAKKFIQITCSAAVFALLSILFLSHTRLNGFISIAPLSVIDIKAGQAIEVRIDNTHAAEIIGRNTITVPYSSFGKDIETGEVIDSACQLAIELSNFDLAKMGVSPFQDFDTRSVEVNDAWMKFIIRSLFENSMEENTTLWIREISNLKPLFP